MTAMAKVEIQQLHDGQVMRTFTYHSLSRNPEAISDYVDRIGRAYNMDHIRILIDGTEYPAPQDRGAWPEVGEDQPLPLCPDCGRGDCTGENCYWPDEAGLR